MRGESDNRKANTWNERKKKDKQDFKEEIEPRAVDVLKRKMENRSGCKQKFHGKY